MRTRRLSLLAACGLALAPAAGDTRESAYRANNRGVGLLEQFRPAEAATAFRQALSLDPALAIARLNLAIALLNVPDAPGAEREARAAIAAAPAFPQPHYVLGLALRSLDRPQEAAAAFRAALDREPGDVGSRVNLGQLEMQARRYDEAIALLRAAMEAEPFNATAAYNLGLALTRAGQAEPGRIALERFRVLRDSGHATLLGQNYPEQGRLAEAVVSTGAEPGLVDVGPAAARFVDVTGEAWPFPPARGGNQTLVDLDRDGDLDVFEVSASGQRFYENTSGRFQDATARVGVDASASAVGAVAGDLDNDGRDDLLVLRGAGVGLLRNDAEKGLLDATKAAGLLPFGSAVSAALADIDHDGDLDIVLGGTGSDGIRLLQNSGSATFSDVAVAAGLAEPKGRVLALVPTDYDNGRDIDLLALFEGSGPRLFRNLRDGTFRDVAASTGFGEKPAPRCVAAADVNKDGFTDFFLGGEVDQLASSNGKGQLKLGPLGSKGTNAALFLDYDNDGLLDLVTAGRPGVRLLRNLGDRFEDVGERGLAGRGEGAFTSLAAGDLDGDGDTDLLLRGEDGALRLLRNESGTNRSLRVRLTGRVSNRSGVGAKVELRAGSLRQKLETYAAVPAPAPSDVLFGLGKRDGPDAVRVIWPAGVLQTELPDTTEASSPHLALDLTELDRKPSSCPYLYAWNGERFAFVTDFMGGGEMGYLVAPGVFNQPDPLEYVRLDGAQVRPRDGRYEIRVTNELEEALFVDRLALLSVAHPADVEVHPYEGMTTPAKPTRFYAVRGLRPPIAAHDDHGSDVLDRLLRVDRRYPDSFRLRSIRGYADPHALTLDLGTLPGHAALLLTGWTDYAFSSDNRAAHQAGLAMRPPFLEVEDRNGTWVTAVEQVGIPVGRPQTVLVDLEGVWRGPSRRVRISTNMRIYWDRIQVATVLSDRPRPEQLPTAGAVLRERGFSAEVSPDGREPFGYEYREVSALSPWKAFPGRYTRVGDVSELLAETDDVFVISRPGDELALSFDASALTPLPTGWKRTFLLLSDGYSKEMDINSATPDAIGPLPFHGMSRYPYASPEAYPMTEARARLMARYNTRIVSTPVPRLEVASAGQPGTPQGAAVQP